MAEPEGSIIECDTDMPFYTPMPVWLTLAAVPPQSKIAWTFLAEHANVGRQMGRQNIPAPKMETIAKAIGTNRQRLREFFDHLVEIGALEIREFRYLGGMRRGYAYKVRFKVPQGYAGPTSLAEYYAAMDGDQFEWVQHRNEAAREDVSAGQSGGCQTATADGSQTATVWGGRTATADGSQTTPARRKARRSKPLVGGNPVPPPPPSSVGPGEDATPEAPLEEDEEMKGNDINPSPEARAHLPQEREGDDEESFADTESAERLPVGLEDIRVVLDRLEGVNVAHVTTEGRLWGRIVGALESGWEPVALAMALSKHTDPSKARSPQVIPDWYANAFDRIGDAPRSARPLCDNPAHARTRVEDVDGGCLMCNTAPKAGTTVETAPVTETLDAASAASACRQALSSRFKDTGRSRNQMPHHRAADEAERNRVKANDLLRGESGR